MNIQPGLMVKKVAAAILFSTLLVTVGCKKDEEANEAKFNANPLNGTQMVPAVTTNASGTVDAAFNLDTKVLKYTVSFSLLNPTKMRLYKGNPGENGVLQHETTVPTNGFITPTIGYDTLDATQEADLLSGKWYLILSSNAHPDGEIRGQLIRN